MSTPAYDSKKSLWSIESKSQLHTPRHSRCICEIIETSEHSYDLFCRFSSFMWPTTDWAIVHLYFQYHPDTCKSGNVQQNTKRFQEIMEAYRVLGKKDSRSSYDASGYTNQTQSNSQQYDQTYHYDYDYHRDRRQTYQNRNQNYGYYSNNRQNNY